MAISRYAARCAERIRAWLACRPATYWLPVLPGWYSWRLLQRLG